MRKSILTTVKSFIALGVAVTDWMRCLPANFIARLRDAPVVLLFLAPGISPNDIGEARTSHKELARSAAGSQTGPPGTDLRARDLNRYIRAFGVASLI